MNIETIAWMVVQFLASLGGAVLGFTVTTYLLKRHDRDRACVESAKRLLDLADKYDGQDAINKKK